MNPRDVPYRDWSLYFNGTYMLYKGEPVYVGVPEPNAFYLNRMSDKKTFTISAPEKIAQLEIWWPMAGAFNLPKGTAIYVGRKANRSMRKSASTNHYYAKWGGGLTTRGSMFTALAKGPNYIPWPEAQEMMKPGPKYSRHSCAICRDLIIDDTNRIIYRGILVGRLEGKEYVPDIPNSPTTKLVLNRLYEENVI